MAPVRRKGFVLAIDSLFALSLALTLLVAVAAFQSSRASGSFLSQGVVASSRDIVAASCAATVSECAPSSATVAGMLSDGDISQADSNLTVCQLLVRLAAQADAASMRQAGNISSELLAPLAGNKAMAVFVDGAQVYSSARPFSRQQSAAGAWVHSHSKDMATPLGPARLEILVWN